MLYCTSIHCRIYKLCRTYKVNIGGDQTVFTDHQKNVKLNKQNRIECPFFSLKPNKDKNLIHSPNTFNSYRSGKGGEFIIPRPIETK
jgi:hypothetical protein